MPRSSALPRSPVATTVAQVRVSVLSSLLLPASLQDNPQRSVHGRTWGPALTVLVAKTLNGEVLL